MARLGLSSAAALATCTPDLQKLVRHVVERLPEQYDLTVLCGFRNEADQSAAFKSGKSKKQWPHGEHNKRPSEAVDLALYPIRWAEELGFAFLAGFVFACASELGWADRLRWGGDFNRDGYSSDETFLDLDHFELRPEAYAHRASTR